MLPPGRPGHLDGRPRLGCSQWRGETEVQGRGSSLTLGNTETLPLPFLPNIPWHQPSESRGHTQGQRGLGGESVLEKRVPRKKERMVFWKTANNSVIVCSTQCLAYNIELKNRCSYFHELFLVCVLGCVSSSRSLPGAQ